MISLHQRKVAIEPIYDPDTTPSGLLYVPEVAKERCDQGIVKYVGHGCKLVEVGDHVIFSGYTGTTVKLEGEGTMIILDERLIMAVIHDDPKEVQGLYFRSKDGEYFTATHEQAAYLLARAMENDPTVRPPKRKAKIESRPSAADYDRQFDDDDEAQN